MLRMMNQLDIYNTSDEEFEWQLEEAAMIQEAEKAKKAAQPKKVKFKCGHGSNAKKSKKTGKQFVENVRCCNM